MRDVPVIDVWRPAHAKRTASVDERCHGILVPGAQDGLLVRLGRTCLLARDEPRADPDSLRAPREVRSESPTIVNCSRTDHVHRLAGQGRRALLADVDARRNEDRRGDVARVTSALAGLSTDEVDACFESLRDVLGVSDHLPKT